MAGQEDMLCGACQTALLRQTLKLDNRYAHHRNCQSFAASLKQRCKLCDLIVLKLSNRDREVFLRHIKECDAIEFAHDSELGPNLTLIHVEAYAPHLLRLGFQINHGHMYNFAKDFFPMQTVEITMSCMCYHISCKSIRIWAKSFDTADPNLLTKTCVPSGISTNSEEAWVQISQWLRTCQTHHMICNKRSDEVPWIPARLLSIDHNAGTYQLVTKSSIEQCSEYITLSHPWGDNPAFHPPKLTISNNTALTRSQPVSSMSRRIFRDAAEVARRLEVHYLWIDSLCIIQDGDDGKDKKEQLPLMDNIYRNALLNISATQATGSSAEETLFSTRAPRAFDHAALRIDINVEVAETNSAMSATFQYLDPKMIDDNVLDAPLNKRAWVVQERILAPRVLHFCANQLFWECCETLSSESHPGEFLVQTLRPGNPLAAKSLEIRGSDDMRFWLETGSSNLQPGDRSYLLWYTVLKAYSRTRITNIDDRLVALSGVARYLQKLAQDQYISGLWTKYLANELLWFVDSASAPCIPTKAEFGPDRYRAPSFSWASCDSLFMPGHPFFGGQILVDVSYVHHDPPHKPFTRNIFGSSQMTEPLVRLKVKGWLRKITIGENLFRGWDIDYQDAPEPKTSANSTDANTRVHLDLRHGDGLDGIYFCIPWLCTLSEKRVSVKGLLVEQPDPAKAVFRRIAYVVEDKTRRLIRGEPELALRMLGHKRPTDRGPLETFYMI